MLEKLKNQGVKFSVFIINLLLMVIAVFAIRERDQNRLLMRAQEGAKTDNEEKVDSFENNSGSASFESQLNESNLESNPTENQDPSPPSTSQKPVPNGEANISATQPSSSFDPSATKNSSSETTSQKKTHADRKTKTS